jgi:hypothetical protein
MFKVHLVTPVLACEKMVSGASRDLYWVHVFRKGIDQKVYNKRLNYEEAARLPRYIDLSIPWCAFLPEIM